MLRELRLWDRPEIRAQPIAIALNGTITDRARHGLAVDFPASSPYVTGAGGSEFNEGTGNYWNTTNNANSGSAISYIPEMAWNDTALGGGLAAGGGGASAVFPKPSWQQGRAYPMTTHATFRTSR